MKELHDRINRVINTRAFEQSLNKAGIELWEFQCTWAEESKGDFDRLPPAYKVAIVAGEQELSGCVELELAAP